MSAQGVQNVVFENETIKITYTLTDNNGSLADVPGGDTLTFKARRYNDGSTQSWVYLTDPELTRQSQGVYEFEYTTGSGIMVSGTNQNQFEYEWQVDGSVTDRERGEFVIVSDL